MSLLSPTGPLPPTSSTLMQALQQDGLPPLGLYLLAVDWLVQWQRSTLASALAPCDPTLLRDELEWFPRWYVAEHRKFTLDAAQRSTLDSAFTAITASNLGGPRVAIHREFTPENLTFPLGSVAPKDPRSGPITYDIASLVRSPCVRCDEDFCLDVTIRYWERARKVALPVCDDFGEFYRAVEWMGLQRDLMALGDFARNSQHSGETPQQVDAPRLIAAVRATCSRYGTLKPLLRLIERVEGIETPSAYSFGRI